MRLTDTNKRQEYSEIHQNHNYQKSLDNRLTFLSNQIFTDMHSIYIVVDKAMENEMNHSARQIIPSNPLGRSKSNAAMIIHIKEQSPQAQ